MRIAKINERERQRIAADIVSAQYHSPGLQRAKFDDLCKKYGRKFVQQFYADLVMKTNPEKVPLKIWDWAACNCTEQHHSRLCLNTQTKPQQTTALWKL